MPDHTLYTLLMTVVEAVATLAFALSGLLEAARKRLDAVGVCVVAGLTAFGGGTLRDVLLDRRPFFWVEHASWLWALLGLCIAAMFVLRARHFRPTERAMQWPDALGLGLFSASGTQLALAVGCAFARCSCYETADAQCHAQCDANVDASRPSASTSRKNPLTSLPRSTTRPTLRRGARMRLTTRSSATGATTSGTLEMRARNASCGSSLPG